MVEGTIVLFGVQHRQEALVGSLNFIDKNERILSTAMLGCLNEVALWTRVGQQRKNACGGKRTASENINEERMDTKTDM